MRFLFLLGSILASSAAFAQQAQPPLPTAIDRVALRIGALTIQIETQQEQIRALQDELAKAQARIKELEQEKPPTSPAGK